jgi:hypothetical protein
MLIPAMLPAPVAAALVVADWPVPDAFELAVIPAMPVRVELNPAELPHAANPTAAKPARPIRRARRAGPRNRDIRGS